ncbi:hypothetical protein [Cellulomonas sp. RIT-PI-Y]|uniref:hypothetical protein n=1 Tax=Cellulomonas sp. RIT-PI-Y TaxID=3035297 RepID=UPI0021DA28A2|nr:hypothetical protein [Cellulomonas sp. RIT-PI-Y]
MAVDIAHVVQPDADAANSAPDEGNTPVSPKRRMRRVLIAAVIVAVVACAGVGTVIAIQNAQRREAITAYEGVSAELAERIAAVDEATDDAAGLLDLGGQVTDPGTLKSLSAALTASEAITPAPDTSPNAAWRQWATEKITAGAAGLEDRVNTARGAAAAITEAATAVRESHQSWQLDRATAALQAAREQLNAGITEGEALLISSDGKVLDNTPRQSLRDLIDRAAAARDQELSENPTADELNALATNLGARTTELATARQAVTDAQAAWQTEQDRVAAEAAAASARSNTAGSSGRNGKKTTSGDAGTTRRNNSSSGSQTGGTTGTTNQPQDNRSWEDMFGGSSNAVCGDTSGQSWDC